MSSKLVKLKKKYFPSEYDSTLSQWRKDGGDYALRFDYNLSTNSTVLDLGGYTGQWASDLYSRHPCKIIIFEPVRGFAEQISTRFQCNRDIEVLQYGLGASNRSESIGVCANESSIFKKTGKTEVIDIMDVKEWFEARRIQTITLMKINIEGGEYELLERMLDTGLIECVDNFQIQFHNFQADSAIRMSNIQKRLSSTHSPVYQYKFIWENWKRIVK